MKILAIIILFSLFIPLIFQIKYGNKSINNFAKMKFDFVCLTSVISQILLTILGIIVMAESLKTPQRQYYCGLPIIGFLVISIFIFFIMLIVMGIQLYIKVSRKSNLD